MSGPDLDAEFAAALAAVRQPHLDRLLALGVTGAAMIAVGLVGVARIEAGRAGLYQPVEHGRPALVLPAWDRAPIRPDGQLDYEAALVDLLAVRPADPERWWLRRGSVALLGEWQVWHASLGSEPIAVHRDPLRWLLTGGAGVVLLHDDGFDTLANLPGLIAEDVEHGRHIKDRLSRPMRTPQIYVRSHVGRAAA